MVSIAKIIATGQKVVKKIGTIDISSKVQKCFTLKYLNIN